MARGAASGVFAFPLFSTMSLVMKMGDLHGVQGYFTQEAHSVLVQQMSSFLPRGGTPLTGALITQAVGPFRSDTSEPRTAELLT